MKKLSLLCALLVTCLSGFAQGIFVPNSVVSGQQLVITGTNESNSAFLSSLFYYANPAYSTIPAGQIVSFSTAQMAGYPWSTSGQPSKWSIVLTLNSSPAVPTTVTFTLRCIFGNNNGASQITADIPVTVTVTPVNTQPYYNAAKSGQFTKNNCGPGTQGTTVTYTVPANTYSSTVSQADADQKATTAVANNGQAYANSNGICKTVYQSTAKSGLFYSTDCADYGGAGYAYTYNVVAGTYQSIISQADADQKAVDDVNTNGQANANYYGPCTSAFKIQISNAENVGNSANVSLAFKTTAPAGIQYEFIVTYPDSSTATFGPQTRNLLRFGISQAGQYQIVARTIASNGDESPWLPITFNAQ